jgi:VCBS repeat-containing protein
MLESLEQRQMLATVTHLGNEIDFGGGWRSTSVAKTNSDFDPNGDVAWGSDGYFVGNGTNSIAQSLPGYISSVTDSSSHPTLSPQVGHLAHDDPTQSIAPTVSDLNALFFSNHAALTHDIFTITLAQDADFVLSVIYDNNGPGPNDAGYAVSALEVSGPATSDSTTGLAQNQTIDYAFFRVQGNASDVFTVTTTKSGATGTMLGGLGFEATTTTPAPTVTHLGNEIDFGGGWRSTSVAKTNSDFDPNGDVAWGSDGYYVGNGSNSVAQSLPSYLTSVTENTSHPTLSPQDGHLPFDDPTQPIAPAVSDVNETFFSNHAALTHDIFTITLAQDADFVLSVIYDNNGPGPNDAGYAVSALEVSGPSTSDSTTGLAQNQTIDYAFFRVQGNASDVFTVTTTRSGVSGTMLAGLGFEATASLPAPVPVQDWRFDDGSGATAANEIAGGNTGTLVGSPTWTTPGQSSTAALDFDGTDFVDGGNINLSATSGGGEATVSMWLHPDALGGDNRIYGQLSGAVGQGGATRVTANGSVQVWSGSAWLAVAPAGALSVGSWQHLAFVWTGNSVQAYVNGQAQLTATTNFDFGATNGNFGIGSRFLNQHGTSFDGKMDEVAIFDAALDQDQIDILAAAPVQHWKFEEGSGTTAANEIAGGNTGTLVGSPTWTAPGQSSTAALDFDGTDFVDGGNINLSATGGGGEATVSMWLHPDALGGDNRIYGQLSGAVGQGGATRVTANGSVQVWSGSAWLALAPAGALSVGSWQHLAFVWTSNSVQAYVDGQAQLTATTNFDFGAANGNFGIGSRFLNQHGTSFDGKMDEIVIFDSAISQDHIDILATVTAVDTTAPTVSTLTPADDGGALASGDLVATFDEDVALLTGSITIYESVGGAVVETFDVATSARVDVSGANVTIDPTNDLAESTSYYVQIDATAIDDLAGNSFQGITDTTTWNFTTVSAALTSFTGGDAGEGLDLTGNFAYALNLGGTPRVVQDLVFASASVSDLPGGVTTTGAPTNFNYSAANGGNNAADYGATASDDSLESMMTTVWYDPNWTLDLDVEVGKDYQLQLIFQEAWFNNQGNANRNFDVSVGTPAATTLVVDDLVLGTETDGASHGGADSGVVLTYTFTATDSSLRIALDDVPGADTNTILNALTLEDLTTTSTLGTLTPFTGGDAGEGLDLTGSIVAFNLGETSVTETVQGVDFLPANVSSPPAGISVVTSGTNFDYFAANGNNKATDYGTTANDNALENIVTNIWYDATDLSFDLDVETGKDYQLQLIFQEGWFTNQGSTARDLDVSVETASPSTLSLALDEFNLGTETNGASQGGPDFGLVYTYSFIADDNLFRVSIDEPGNLAVLAAVTLEDLNIAPTITGTVAGQNVNDNATVQPFSGATIGDDDGDSLNLIVTLDVAANGTLSGGGFTETGVGTGVYIVSAADPAAAQTAIQALTFTPTENQVAPTSTVTSTFTISVDDSTAAAVTDNTTTVIATSINDAPVTIDGSLNANEDGATVTTGVLASDIDTDDDANSLTYAIANGPAEGSASSNGDGTFTFDPGSDFQDLAALETRMVSFDVSATDTHSATSNTSTVTVTVTGVNDAPATIDGSLNADEDGAAVTTSVLASDVDSDDDANSLTYAISNGPAEGSATSNGDGTFTFDPGADFQDLAAGATRSVSFDVTATDGQGVASNTSTVDVTVTGVNDLPVITQGDGPLLVTMSEDGSPTAFVAPTLAATDIDGDTLTWSASSSASPGDENVSGTGASPTTFTYTPHANHNGTDSFTIEVSDGNGGTDSITVDVTIEQVNDPAIFSGDLSGEGINITGTLLATDPLDGMTNPNYTVVSQGSLGTAGIDATTGDWSFTPNVPLVLGDDAFTVQVTDDDGNLETQVISITVSPVFVDDDGNLIAESDDIADRFIFSNGGGSRVITRLNNQFYGPHTVTNKIIARGNGGNDRISISGNLNLDVEFYGGGGRDNLAGGTGNDFLDGGDSSDTILTGAGDNTALGGNGNDQLAGRNGSDTLIGQNGNDVLIGGSGRDVLIGDDLNDALAIGRDHITGGSGDDLLVGGPGNDVLAGGFGNDVLIAGDGNDLLRGNANEDLLIAGRGNDRAFGDSSADRLVDGQAANEGDQAALISLLAEWAGPSTGLNRPYSNAGALTSDTDADFLSGGGSTDAILFGGEDGWGNEGGGVAF